VENSVLLDCASLFLKLAKQYWGKKASGLLFVCTEDQTVLLLKRSYEVEQPGTWGIAGGAIGEGFYETTDFEQDPPNKVFLESAQREAAEELGTLPNTKSLLGITEFTDGSFTYKTFVYDMSLFEKNRWTPAITLNWENDEDKWFPIDSLPGNLHFGLVHTVKELAEKNIMVAKEKPKESLAHEGHGRVICRQCGTTVRRCRCSLSDNIRGYVDSCSNC